MSSVGPPHTEQVGRAKIRSVCHALSLTFSLRRAWESQLTSRFSHARCLRRFSLSARFSFHLCSYRKHTTSTSPSVSNARSRFSPPSTVETVTLRLHSGQSASKDMAALLFTHMARRKIG